MSFCPDPDPMVNGTPAQKLRYQAAQLERQARDLENKEYLGSAQFQQDWLALLSAAEVDRKDREYDVTLQRQMKALIAKVQETQRRYADALWEK